ncbi:MAG: glycosyltransferase [Leptospiraceae bacterium]|nr:glycosyltransferase [Leptospiraceae bacterium]
MARLLQLSAGVAPYDATLSLMLGLAHSFADAGGFRHFDIYARHVPRGFKISDSLITGRKAHPLEDLEPKKYSSEDLLVYHHGIASDAENLIRQFPGPRFLVYHGLTPARFYLPYNLSVAGRLERGRRELSRLSSVFERAYCFSAVTEADLRGAGYLNIRKVDPPLYEFSPPALKNDFFESGSDGSARKIEKNSPPVALSLGRIVPNKNHEPLIRMAASLKRLHPGAKVLLAGELRPGLETYHRHLRDLIRALDVADTVELPGLLDPIALESLWKRSTHFVCTSLHEGFCIPLVEAMVRQRPVLYLMEHGSAASETMDGAGLGFRPMDPDLLAELICETHENETLRTSILTGQTQRLHQFKTDDLVHDILEQLVTVGVSDD